MRQELSREEWAELTRGQKAEFEGVVSKLIDFMVVGLFYLGAQCLA